MAPRPYRPFKEGEYQFVLPPSIIPFLLHPPSSLLSTTFHRSHHDQSPHHPPNTLHSLFSIKTHSSILILNII